MSFLGQEFKNPLLNFEIKKVPRDVAPCAVYRLFKRRGIHQAALGPKRVQAPFDAERGVGAHVAFEYFAVIADEFDDIVSPFFVETEGLAIAGIDPQKPLNLGIFAGKHLINVL
jgi:hypothetical protein